MNNNKELPSINNNNIRDKLNHNDRANSNYTVKNNSDTFEKNNKIENLEKLVNILYNSHDNLEKRISNEIIKLKKDLLNEKEIRKKLEIELKNSEGLNEELSNNIYNRVNDLESKTMNIEFKNSKLNEKSINQEQIMRELSAFVQNLNSIDRNEIMELKSIIKEKISEDQQIFLKEREKSKALFTEVVRLGDIQQKYVNNLQVNNIEIENRMNSIEQKLFANEKNIIEQIKKADSSKELYEKWNEKYESRLNELENGLVNIGVI